jgi:acyl carrier protein
MSDALQTEVRGVLRQHAGLPVDPDTLDPGADLFAAGMTSHASVSVMLALEAQFDVEFPDEMLKREVFMSIDAMAGAVGALQGQAP